jgi:hypothetical protein
MEELVVATAVWGDWPKTREAKGGRFDDPKQDGKGKGQAHLDRGGRAAMQGEYIRRLANAVKRNLDQPHDFICFADDVDKVPAGIHAEKLDVPYISRAMPKAYIYGAPFTGCPIPFGTRMLILDLDVVITGDLSPLVDHGRELVARERKYRLPKRDPDGDIIFSLAGSDKARYIADIFEQEMANECQGSDHGDDRLVMRWAGAECWIDVVPGAVESYKWGRKRGFPTNVRIVSFHGRPLPDQAQEHWVRQYWR